MDKSDAIRVRLRYTFTALINIENVQRMDKKKKIENKKIPHSLCLLVNT